MLPELMLVLLAVACGQRYELGEVLQPAEAVATNESEVGEPVWPVIVDDLGDVEARMAIDYGADSDPAFGSPVGDVDGDGYDDYLTGHNPNDALPDAFRVLYGGPRAENGIFPAAAAATTRFAFNAETAPTHQPATEEVFDFTSVEPYPAGDVDGDGCADILFASRRRVAAANVSLLDGAAAQRAYLWYGRPDRPLSAVHLDDEAVQFEPLPALREALPDVDLKGIDQTLHLTALGDIDADGFDDIAYSYYVRVPNPVDTDETSRATTLIYYGSAERLPARGAAALSDAQISGVKLTGPLGDIDGDGSADFWMVPVSEDELRLDFGRSERLSGDVSAAAFGGAVDVPYPSSDLRAAGDLDHDGIDDFILVVANSPQCANGECRQSFETHLFYGSPSWRDHIIDRDRADAAFFSDWFVYRLTPVGDWDGDGFDDLVFSQRVYARDDVATGDWREARLIPGTADRFEGRYDILGRTATAAREEGQLGGPDAVFPLGDVDGDGFGDARISISGLERDPYAGWFIKYGAPLVSDIY